MSLPSLPRRLLLACMTGLALASPALLAQETSVKFQLDWRFEGPSALFLVPVAQGYFCSSRLSSEWFASIHG